MVVKDAQLHVLAAAPGLVTAWPPLLDTPPLSHRAGCEGLRRPQLLQPDCGVADFCQAVQGPGPVGWAVQETQHQALGRPQARGDPASPKVTGSGSSPRMGPRRTFRGTKPLTLSGSPHTPCSLALHPKCTPFSCLVQGPPPRRPLPQPAPGSTSRWAGSCGLPGRLNLVPWCTLMHP